jgi:hypothetical protein
MADEIPLTGQIFAVDISRKPGEILELFKSKLR